MEIRVEDAPDPNKELRRLLRVKRAYMALQDAGRAGDDKAAAAARLQEALTLAPEMVEIAFWGGLEMAQAGQLEAGSELMIRAVKKDRRWIETIDRLVAAERVPADVAREIQARLTAGARHP